MNRRLISTLSIASALTFVAACSMTKSEPPPPPTVAVAELSGEKGGGRAQEVTVTATVEKVDVKERLVTLRGPGGGVEQLRVGDDVRNLAQVKKGDQVVVTYFQSVAFQVLKPGEAKPSISGATDGERAELGEKPGGVAARRVVLVAKILKLDRANQLAVLEGPEGRTITVDVQNPDNFNKVKVGDTVEIELTEALAIDVQPAPK
jgi:Cu/Ag efflux protein CusF